MAKMDISNLEDLFEHYYEEDATVDSSIDAAAIRSHPELKIFLYQAVVYNYVNALKEFLANTKKPSEYVNKEYMMKGKRFVPLLTACKKGYDDIVEVLLKNGAAASLQKHNKHKYNCLHFACSAANFQMVQSLCSYVTKLPERVKKAVLNRKSESGWTPLMFAVMAKRVDIVRCLVQIPEVELNSRTKKGHNVIHIAAQHSLECLKVLCSLRQVSPELFLDTDKQGWNTIHRACAGGNINTLKWLLDLRTKLNVLDEVSPSYANILKPGDDGFSTELPLLFQPQRHNEKTKNGYTPLLIACEYQYKDMVEYLLSLPGIDPAASTATDGNEGNTGLHIAAIHDSPDIAELLILHQCPIMAINKQGDTALHVARRKSSFDVVDILRAKGGNGLKGVQNKNGQLADEIDPEEVIPPEIQKRGPEAVRIFHKALREGEQKIPHCKLIVLGEARVGKTSLVRHMTGLKFDPKLESTHGIENQCIATMIDSKNVNINNWRTMSAEEQADRDQEHYAKAIAEAVKKEDPALLAVKKAKVHPNEDEDIDEDYITEDGLVRLITEFFDERHKKMLKSLAFAKALGSREFGIKLLARPQSVQPTEIRTHPPQEQQRSQTITITSTSQNPHPAPLPIYLPHNPNILYPTENPKPDTKPILPVPSTEGSVPPPQVIPLVHEPNTTPINPQIKTGTQLTSGSGIGRRKARNISKMLPSAAQQTEAPTLSFEVYDFAGQTLYRPMHHCFMSRRAIYFVVFNLQDHYEPEVKQKTFSDLQYWLNSIHAHVHNPGYKYEKYIFIVGTHRHPSDGKCVTDDDLKKFSDEFLKYLSEHNCRVIDDIHFCGTNLSITGVENSSDQNSSGVEDFKEEIKTFSAKDSKNLPFLAESYPIRWMNFRGILLKKKKADSPMLQLTEVKEIAKDCGVDEQAVHTALQLFHDTGVIIYPAVLKAIFLEHNEKEQISSVILMEPRWLISIMTKVMEVQMSNPAVKNTDIEKLRKTGMTTGEVLFKLWEDDHGGNDEKFETICLLMRAHGLMQVIKPSVATDHIHQLSSNSNICIRKLQFVIPCMLKQEEEGIPSGYTFYFDFKGFLPQEVFHCLICLVIKKCQEIPGSPKCSANGCIWYCFKGFDWYVQLLREEHKLKVVTKKRIRKSGDLTSMECISFLHEEYIRPICEQSGLPGLTYVAGPLVEECKQGPHPVGVLPVVCYPDNTSPLGECPHCREEYDMESVLAQTCCAKGSSVLGEDDLHKILCMVKDITPKWEDLGLALRLKHSELQIIKKEHPNDPRGCLKETLFAWLQQKYDIKKYGLPSWDLLCEAVQDSTGGDNPALAKKIAEQCKK